MKKSFNLIVLALFSLFAFHSCSDDDGPGTDPEDEYDYTEIITDYVDNTVLPTYADMKNQAISLAEKTEIFLTNGTQANLNAVCEQWVKTRVPWESSEAFLYGPADFKNLDPLLDSWPLDQSQLDQVLASSQQLTADFVRNGLGSGLRGFHTIEYLLFREGGPRNAGEVTTREKEYLVSVTEVLRDDCITLWAMWAGVEEGTVEAEILENLEIEIGVPYREEFINAGKAGSRYLSQAAAVEEMLQGMIDIAEEVASQKIAGPVASGKVEDVESWFSWNSLTDFKDNIRSIENVYINGYQGSTPGASLSAFVKEQNTELDAEVKAKIAGSITALNGIPEPFRNNLNNTEKTGAAIDAILELRDVLNKKVLPLIVD
ncbi:MAG: imelysin family protein [Mangrovibacterium sp.]